MLRVLTRRLRALFRKGEVEHELEEELRFHLEKEIEQNRARGMSGAEARAAALRGFGGLEQAKEGARDVRGVRALEELLQDLRYGARMLRRSPGFAAAAMLTVALGIGACTAIFSVVNGVLLRPLPFREPARVVVFKETLLGRPQDFQVSSGKFHDWKNQAHSFESIAATTGGGDYTLTEFGEPIRLSCLRIGINALSTLGVKPLLGRDFLPEDVPAVRDFESFGILGYGAWQRLFGGRADVVGQTVQLSGRPVTIVGVLPRDSGLVERDIFTPLAFSEPDRRYYDTHWLQVFGRLKPGVTLAEAQSEMSVIAERAERNRPASVGWGVKLVPIAETVVGEVRPVLFSLLGAVALLLLIACANVANLLLARATSRSKEMATRAALGAGGARIMRQVLVESVLLALLGGALGLLFARVGLAGLLALAPETLPRAQHVVLDGRALGATLALAMLTGVIFGMAPALQAARTQLHETLKRSGQGSQQSGRHGLRSIVVVGELAIALVLLAGAGLLMRSFSRLVDVDPGFNPREALVARVFLQISLRSPDARARSVAFADAVVDRMRALPGVRAVSVVSRLPFEAGQTMPFTIVGQPSEPGGNRPVSTHFNVGPDYFRAMGIRVLRGRGFEARDAGGASMVAIINESIAKKFFPGDDPLGERISIGGPPCEIVGIAGDVRADRLDGEATFQTYQPFAQASPVRAMAFVVRTAGPPARYVSAVRATLSQVEPTLPTQNVRPLSTLVADSIARQRFAMTLFTVFSGLALLLAAIGIYSVMAYSVAQRTGEIGIRMALGAHAGKVLRLVLTHGGCLIALGVLIGVVSALLLTRLLEKLVFGVSTHDPLTFMATVMLLVVVAGTACLLPARRASKVSPMIALRAE